MSFSITALITLGGIAATALVAWLVHRVLKDRNEAEHALKRNDLQNQIATLEDRLAAARAHAESQRDLLKQDDEELKARKQSLNEAIQRQSILATKLDARDRDLERVTSDYDTAREHLRQRDRELSEERSAHSATKEKLRAEMEHHEDKVRVLTETVHSLEQRMKTIFEAAASRIIEEKGQAFTQLNAKNLQGLIEPLGKDLESFRKTVTDTGSASQKQHARLEKQLETMAKAQAQMSDEANALTEALRGNNKTQGDWGEFRLRRVLESAGLEEGKDFDMQVRVKTEAGELIPDCVVRLPRNRAVVVDSKVTLKAFHDYRMATSDEERAGHAKALVKSFRAHVDALGGKYSRLPGLETPERVIMFVPVEPAFALVMEQDRKLFDDAAKKGVVLATSNMLLMMLWLVDHMWQQEAQSTNAAKALEYGEKLYDKLVAFVGDLEKVGKALGSATKSYDDAFKKLTTERGNVIRRAEQLKSLRGVNPKKSLRPELVEGAASPLVLESGIGEASQGRSL